MAVPPLDLKLDFKAFMKQLEQDSIPDPKYSITDYAGVEQRTLKWSTDKFKWPETYAVTNTQSATTFKKQLLADFNFDDIDLTPSQAELDRQKRVDDLLRKQMQQAMLYGSRQFLKPSMNQIFTWDDNPCREVTPSEALKKKNRLDEVKAVKAICDLLAKALT